MLENEKKRLNAAGIIVPPVPRKDFWTDPNHFNLEEDPLEHFPGAELLGRLPSKRSVDVKRSILGVGFETLDRDTFDPRKTIPFLAESGVKFARCQTGWMKCEKVPGEYDFSWLDEVVNSLAGIGIETWFSLSFGHPVHTPAAAYEKAWREAAGKIVPGWARGWVGEVPLYHGENGMNAWEQYVRALCRHFRGRVRYYEVWNEPETFWCHNGKSLWDELSLEEKARDYTRLVAKTAEAVHAEIPDAKIIAVAAQTGTSYIKALGKNKLADHIDIFSYHFYGPVPEEFIGERVNHLRACLRPSDPAKKIRFWQGESGRASGKSMLFSFPTEMAQAKYLTRRFLTDLACGAELSSIFTVTDFLCYYPDGRDQYYGVIDAKHNCGKLAYYAMQGMGFLFDGLVNAPDNFCAFRPDNWQAFEPRAPYRVEAHAFRRNGKPLFAFWNPEHVELSAPAVYGSIYMLMDDAEMFENPVVIDPIRRNIWQLDEQLVQPTLEGGNFYGALRIHRFPVMDYPLFIADASMFDEIQNSSFPVFLNCSRESREVPEFIVPTLIEKNTNFFG